MHGKWISQTFLTDHSNQVRQYNWFSCHKRLCFHSFCINYLLFFEMYYIYKEQAYLAALEPAKRLSQSNTVYRVIRVFSQEYLQGQNKNVLIKSTLQKLFWAQSFTPHYLLTEIKSRTSYTLFAAPSLKQSDFAIAVQRVLIVTYFPVVGEWKARKMWKVIYLFQKSLNKTCMTVLFEEKEFVVFI